MKTFLKSISAVMMSVLLVLCGMPHVKAEEDFDEFLKQEWKTMMESDYTTMHFSVKDPSSMGLTKPEVSWGHVSYDEFAKNAENAKKSLDHLHQFSYDKLTESQKIDYLVYERYLKTDAVVNSSGNFSEMFNPYNGLYSNLTTTMTEFIFYTREDIDDYLILIEDYPRYLDEMLAFTDEQVKKGYFMSDNALDVQLEQMEDFIEKGEENPLVVIFNKNIDKFEGLTDEEKDAYKEKNLDLVLNRILPAVAKAAEQLETYRGTRKVASVREYPDGMEYYTVLANMKCSSDESLQEKYDYLKKAVRETVESYQKYMVNNLNPEFLTGDIPIQQAEFNSPEEILQYLSQHLEGFPKGPDITYEISYLDPSVANPSVMAYYLSTPIDDVHDNVIRVNGESDAGNDINTMYYTLAHEGLPGHMYQFTWYYSQEYNPLRHDLNVIGYTEGWAQYVERIMLERSPLDRMSIESTAANVFLGYALQSWLDIAYNGLGYTDEQVLSELQAIGLGNGIDIEAVKTSVLDMPGQILPYGYGMAKFWELRERTESALEGEMDLEQFHLTLLTNGPRPFNLVEKDVAAYVESKGKTLPKDFTFMAHEVDTSSTSGLGSAVSFATQHPFVVLGIALLIFLLIIVITILIIRALIRLITGKKKKKAEAE